MRLKKILGVLILLGLTAAASVSADFEGCLYGDCNSDCAPCGGRFYGCDEGYPICACYNC